MRLPAIGKYFTSASGARYFSITRERKSQRFKNPKPQLCMYLTATAVEGKKKWILRNRHTCCLGPSCSTALFRSKGFSAHDHPVSHVPHKGHASWGVLIVHGSSITQGTFQNTSVLRAAYSIRYKMNVFCRTQISRPRNRMHIMKALDLLASPH